MSNRKWTVKVFMSGLGFLGCATSAFAQGGNMLPASAKAKGYSLSQIAVATAVYNTGQMVGNPLTPPPPDVPFEILVGDATVKPGTMLYLPIFVVDDSGGAPPGFPTDITNLAADATFLYSFLLANYGITDLIVQVDGQTTIPGADYVTGTTTAPLLDGTPAGTHYIVSAAFLTPPTPGEHTVGIGGLIDGEPVVFLSYTVTVH